MSRLKTTNTPDLQGLLKPQNPTMLAVEQAVLRGYKGAHAAASVADQIAVRLAGLITMDAIHAGQRLLEKDISEVLSVSRAPVREALRILERERLVEFQPRRGAVVTAPDAQDLRDIYVVRGALYGILLRQLMETRAADLEVVLGQHMPALNKAAEERSVDDYSRASFLLNLAMADLSSNQLVGELLISISLRTFRYARLGLAANPESVGNSVRTWCALQRAVAKRDVDAVLRTAQKRIEVSRDAAVRAIEAPAAPVSRRAGSGRAPAAPETVSLQP